MASQWGVTIPCVTELERKDFQEYISEYFTSFRHFLVGLNATSATVDDIMQMQDRGSRIGALSGKSRRDLIEALGGMDQNCAYCHRPLSARNFAIAHRMPYVIGGDYDKSNLFLAHATCNLQAGPAVPKEMVHMFVDWAEATGRPSYSIALDAIAKWNALKEKLSHSQLFRRPVGDRPRGVPERVLSVAKTTTRGGSVYTNCPGRVEPRDGVWRKGSRGL